MKIKFQRNGEEKELFTEDIRMGVPCPFCFEGTLDGFPGDLCPECNALVTGIYGTKELKNDHQVD